MAALNRKGGYAVLTAALVWLLVFNPALAEQRKGPVVFAAASLKTALDAIAKAYEAKNGSAPVVSYASSGALAKQIAEGAPADLFISADEKWMDVLAKDGAIRLDTRHDLLGNSLVLVEPSSQSRHLSIEPGFDLAGAIGDGKLAVCTVSSCPAGIYGKQALQTLGVWSAVEPKLAQAENVRAALLLVARGEATLGIVYATDARVEPAVKVVGIFPEASHAPIVYPVALTTISRHADAADFEAFLGGHQAVKILEDQGFTVLGR